MIDLKSPEFFEIFMIVVWKTFIWGFILYIPVIFFLLMLVLTGLEGETFKLVTEIFAVFIALIANYVGLVKALNANYKNFTIRIEITKK